MSNLLPVLAIVFNALVWGVSWWPFHVLQGMGVHPLWATVLMYCVPLVGIVLVRPAMLREFARPSDLWALLVVAGLTNTCFNWAITIGDVIRVVLLFYLMPAWAVLLAWWLLGERPTTMAIVRIVLALAGVALVLQPAGQGWRLPLPSGMADGLALAGGFMFAATNVLLSRSAVRHSPLARVWAMFAGGALLGGLVAGGALLTHRYGVTPLPPLAAQWGLVVLAASAAFMLSNTALQYGSARLTAHAMSLIMLLEVVFATTSSAWAGAAHLTAQTALGGMLVMSAAVLAAVSAH